MADKIKVVIDRSKWRTGGDNGYLLTGKGETMLLNDEGYMCCLGFVCKAANPELDIRGHYYPKTLKDIVPGINEKPHPYSGEKYIDTLLACRAATINDDTNMVLVTKEKEATLIKLFKDTQYELEFVGEYTKEET
jgi:hypothetical protein